MIFIFSQRSKIGYVRYDYVDKKTLSVSIAVKEKYKRKGFGKLMLAKTLRKKEISKFNVIASIKRNNFISKEFFLDAGFKFLSKDVYIYKKI